jgi:hypothetical protein
MHDTAANLGFVCQTRREATNLGASRTAWRSDMTANDHSDHGGHPYVMFWANMALGLVVMYFVMFSMIDGLGDFRNNLNMF